MLTWHRLTAKSHTVSDVYLDTRMSGNVQNLRRSDNLLYGRLERGINNMKTFYSRNKNLKKHIPRWYTLTNTIYFINDVNQLQSLRKACGIFTNLPNHKKRLINWCTWMISSFLKKKQQKNMVNKKNKIKKAKHLRTNCKNIQPG